jgi:hypothetical protein
LFTEEYVDTKELQDLQKDIDDLKRAVRRFNPFLRSIMRFRSYALLSLPFGLAILAYCLCLHFLALSGGSTSEIPEAWENAAWFGLAAIMVLGLIGKLVIVNRKVAQVEEGATFFTATKAMFGGTLSLAIAPLILLMAVASVFAVAVHHPWYVEPVLAFCFSMICTYYALATESRELVAMSWYMLLSGLASLFFIESAPFLWSAAIWAGCFLCYGICGLVFIKAERRP